MSTTLAQLRRKCLYHSRISSKDIAVGHLPSSSMTWSGTFLVSGRKGSGFA